MTLTIKESTELKKLTEVIDDLVKNEYEETGYIVCVDFSTSPAFWSDVYYNVDSFIDTNKITFEDFDASPEEDDLSGAILEFINFDKIVERYRDENESKLLGYDNNEKKYYDIDCGGYEM